MRVILFGGSFDPPHLGHINMVERVIHKCDSLIIMPAGKSPLKEKSHIADAIHRFEMSKLAFLKISDKINVSDYEINSSIDSYTINTVLWLLKKYKNCSIRILIGKDQLSVLNKWKYIDELVSLVDFICFDREINDDINNNFMFKIEDFSNNISSTAIRNKINSNFFSYRDFLCREVYNYIKKNKIYETC